MTLNPVREPLIETIYFMSYAPILILGLVGMVLARRGWREQSLIYLQFLVFIAVSAVFWAHTSHRTHLDVYLIIFSAFAIDRFLGNSLRSLIVREGLQMKDRSADQKIARSSPIRRDADGAQCCILAILASSVSRPIMKLAVCTSAAQPNLAHLTRGESSIDNVCTACPTR